MPSGTYKTIQRARRRTRFFPLTSLLILLLTGGICAGVGWWVYHLPPVYEKLFWRVEMAKSQVRELLKPRAADILPTAQNNNSLALKALATTQVPALPVGLDGATPTPSPTFLPAFTRTSPAESATPSPIPSNTSVPSPTPSPTPLPSGTVLAFNKDYYEYQKWNNCAPVNLAMGLKYWGWKGDQFTAASVLKPDPKDRNVRPDELLNFVKSEASGIGTIYRVGGDLSLIKTILTYGYPVLVESGYRVEDKGWMGHYELITGYDDTNAYFIVQDSYLGPNHRVNYADFDQDWQNFNRLLIVLFPLQEETRVLQALGRYARLEDSYQIALETAQNESQSNPKNAFAWFNLGTNWAIQGDYSTAAAAFDEARNAGLPWRMLWYQFELYHAYYEVGRLDELIALTTHTLDEAGGGLEESFFWRGWAQYAKGDTTSALKDLQTALELNPNFYAAQSAQTSIQNALADQTGKPSDLVQGKVVLENDLCCMKGTVGSALEVRASFTAASSAGEVSDMRVVTGTACSENVNMEGASWEKFSASKTYQTSAPLEYATYAVCVQFRDTIGNLSRIYIDDISLEGLRPSPTP